MRIDSVEHPPWGVAGGHAAGTGRCIVNPGRPDERVLRPLSDGNIVKRGDIVRIETGGGGGWGHPFDREPERVAGRRARRLRQPGERGGALRRGDGRRRSIASTWRPRRKRRARRPAAKLFHRHGYHDVLA